MSAPVDDEHFCRGSTRSEGQRCVPIDRADVCETRTERFREQMSAIGCVRATAVLEIIHAKPTDRSSDCSGDDGDHERRERDERQSERLREA